MRVLVPFGKGNKTSVAFVYEIIENVDANYEIKDILNVIDDNRLISDELMKLAFFMSKNYMSPIQASIKQVMPPTDIKDIKVYYYNKRLTDRELSNYLSKKRQMSDIVNNFGDIKDKILHLVKKNEIGVYYDIKNTQNVRYDEYAELVDGIVINLTKNARKQAEIIDYLKDNGKIKVSELLSKTNAPRSSYKSLINKGFIKVSKKERDKELNLSYNSYQKLSLNDEQDKAFNIIKNNSKGEFLLFGVTGSGKTEIFLQMVEEVIKRGQEAIILVPEISLTPQTI